MSEEKKPFAASLCSKPVKKTANDDSANYSVDSQLNKNWEETARRTPTYRSDTEDYDD